MEGAEEKGPTLSVSQNCFSQQGRCLQPCRASSSNDCRALFCTSDQTQQLVIRAQSPIARGQDSYCSLWLPQSVRSVLQECMHSCLPRDSEMGPSMKALSTVPLVSPKIHELLRRLSPLVPQTSYGVFPCDWVFIYKVIYTTYTYLAKIHFSWEVIQITITLEFCI